MAPEEVRLRLFVALELPGAVRAELVRWRESVAGEVSGLRAVGEAGLHVTLCFLGSQPEAVVAGILGACESVLAGRPPVELAMAEPAWLPRRAPRVLAVGLTDTTGALAGLQGALAQALAAGGWYRPERRRFLPHVTVARVARVARGSRARPATASARPATARVRPVTLAGPGAPAFTASRVTLFRSLLGGAGARYEALGGVVLGS